MILEVNKFGNVEVLIFPQSADFLNTGMNIMNSVRKNSPIVPKFLINFAFPGAGR